MLFYWFREFVESLFSSPNNFIYVALCDQQVYFIILVFEYILYVKIENSTECKLNKIYFINDLRIFANNKINGENVVENERLLSTPAHTKIARSSSICQCRRQNVYDDGASIILISQNCDFHFIDVN